MKPQRRDSYQPRESGVHSKRWTRGGVGSSPGGIERGGDEEESRVSMVCRGRVGSQESIQWAVGSKPMLGDMIVAA